MVGFAGMPRMLTVGIVLALLWLIPTIIAAKEAKFEFFHMLALLPSALLNCFWLVIVPLVVYASAF